MSDSTRGSDTALVMYFLSSDVCGSIMHVILSSRPFFACIGAVKSTVPGFLSCHHRLQQRQFC